MRKISLYFLVVLFVISLSCFIGCNTKKQTPPTHSCINSLEYVSEVPATGQSNGVKEHYVCKDCAKLYLDGKGEREVTAKDLVLEFACLHNLELVSEVPATEQSNGVKEHYKCLICSKLFLDESYFKEVKIQDLVLIFKHKDKTLSLTYNFSGEESSKKGYAQGSITLDKTDNFNVGDNVEFFWGKNSELLSDYYPIYQKKITTETNTISFELEENVYIPQLANQIVVLKNGEFASSFDIESNKLYEKRELLNKYAVLSDVHQNYSQGKDHLLNALNELQTLGVQYIILSGDIGKETANYNTYIETCKKSKFTGLIFSSTGNHDQELIENRAMFKQCAVYDGSSKSFINLNDIVEYFKDNGGYKGDLNVNAYYQDIEGNGNTLYYYVEINNNVYFFMDQMINLGSSTPVQDNFSVNQLNLLESVLYEYSNAGKNIFIVEHAPIEQYKVGDKFTPKYGAQLKVSNAYVNNKRFTDILKEYTEAIMLTGHTHVQYDVAINFLDKVYNEQEVLTNVPLARTFHVSSISQPRWYEGEKIIMSNKVSSEAGSEGYVVYEYLEDIVFEGNSFKEKGVKPYKRNVFSKYSYVVPTMSNTHTKPTPVQVTEQARGDIFYNGMSFDLGCTYSKGLSFEYKITTSERIKANFYGANLNGSMNWDKYYGGFELTNDGGNYDGLTITTLADGYVKVEMNFAKIKRLPHGAPANVRYVYFEQFKITNSNNLSVNTVYDGYLDNICEYTPEDSGDDTPQLRGNYFCNGQTIDLGSVFSTGLSFEYIVTTSDKINAKFYGANTNGTMNWEKYYGGFELTNDGGVYDGLTVTKLADGYVKVEMNFAKIMNRPHGAPENVRYLYFEQIKQNDVNTVYDGYIDKIESYTPSGENQTPTYRGDSFANGSDKSFKNFKAVNTITFDYMIVSGEKFAIALMKNWGNDGEGYFGYFDFNKDGLIGTQTGVTYQKLQDGYVRVVFDLTQLTKIGDHGKPTEVDHLYIRGIWTTASGYIDNIVVS